tara:strand:- start:48 stop:1715 length:1668 start_codon:yes stop_codon:yes gene_type:complete
MAEVSLKNLKDNPERLATLIDKVKKRSPFTRVGGKIENDRDNVYLRFVHPSIEGILLKGPHTEITGRGNNQIFVETNSSGRDKNPQKTFALSDLEKTTELGSSKGSGGGAEATAITESMQCFFTSYLFNGREDKFDLSKDYEKALKTFYNSVTNSNYVHAYNKASRYEFNALWDKSPKDEEWLQTYMATANMIKDKSTNFDGNVYFHRGSPFMDSIYEKKKTCEKHNKDLIKSGEAPSFLAESLTSFSNDKWNPGDIWMSTNKPTDEPFSWTPPEMKKDMKTHVCDWVNLQKSVYESAHAGETLGISLKKTGKTAKFSEFNTPEEKQEIKYRGFKFGNGDFFNSADVYIEFSGGGSMQYRPTDGNKSWQGEIKGTKASGGKAGGGATNYYTELYFGKSIDANSKLPSGTWKEKKGEINDADKKKMHELYLIHNRNQTSKKRTEVKISKEVAAKKGNPYTTLQDFSMVEKGKDYIYTSNKDEVNLVDFKILGDNYTTRGKNASKNFYFGKYMALVFIDAVEASSTSPGNRNGFATDVIRYAQSNIDNVSTYFWKIF